MGERGQASLSRVRAAARPTPETGSLESADFVDRLVRVGMRPTRLRLRLLGVLARHGGSWVSLENILRAMFESGPGEGISSVYRTLSAFGEAGLVQRSWHGNKRTRSVYRLARGTAGDDVVVLICDGCQSRFRVIDPVVRDALMQLRGQHEGASAPPVAMRIDCGRSDICSTTGLTLCSAEESA